MNYSLYGTAKGLRFKETAQRPVVPLVACMKYDLVVAIDSEQE